VRLLFCALLLIAVSLPVCAAQSASAAVTAVSKKIDAGHYRAALQALAPLLERNAADAQLLALRGRAQLALHQNAAATDSFRQAVKLSPRNGRYCFWLGQALVELIPQVSVFSRAPLAKELRGAYQHAVELAPDFIPAHEAMLDFYVQAPFFFGGSLAKAREQATTIAKLHPARGARARAVIAAAEGHAQTAIGDYKIAIQQAPHDVELRVELGKLYLQQAFPHEACIMFRQALQLAPDHIEALQQLGWVASRSGQRVDLQAGARALRHLVALAPEGVSMAEVRQHLEKIESMLQT